MIQDESARQKVHVPADLWHSMIMFTSGSIARQELARLSTASTCRTPTGIIS